ncbi:MAG TPA: hypothetical protein VK530_19425, partial [Candidatus Acidoferrum sp.]|nr:hypothetical protein [Candidatus Acidoferrum sp.]
MTTPLSQTSPSSELDRQPITYSGRVRYTPVAAARYQRRKEGKHNAEMALVEQAVSQVPIGTVLDVPCGGGRV